MARRMSKAAQACISSKISKHCRKKRGKCRRADERAQAVAIAFSQCRRAGHRSIPKRR